VPVCRLLSIMVFVFHCFKGDRVPIMDLDADPPKKLGYLYVESDDEDDDDLLETSVYTRFKRKGAPLPSFRFSQLLFHYLNFLPLLPVV